MAKRRRSYGSGSIFRRGDYYYLQTCVNGKMKATSLHEKDYNRAVKAAEELFPPSIQAARSKEEIITHVAQARKIISSSRLSIANAWDAFLASTQRPDSGKETLRKYSCFWQQFAVWLQKERPNIQAMAEVDATTVQSYFSTLAGRKLSSAGFNGHRQALHLIFRILKTPGGLDENPVEDVAKRQKVEHSHKELTTQQVSALLAVFDKPGLNLMHRDEMRVMFHIGIFTGLRLADCALLRWDCMNMTRRLLSVMPLKTQRKGRTVVIPLHPSLEAELLNAQNWKDDSGFVLPQVAQRYESTPSGVQKDAVWIFEQAGMKTSANVKGRELAVNQFGFHSLRHTFVSICAKAGVPLPVVQSIVGHGNPAMTRHYIHVGEESARQAIATLPHGTPVLPPASTPLLDEVKQLIEQADEKTLQKIRKLLHSPKHTGTPSWE
ncbi:MAG: hypothetical protein A2X49_03970 [Lentisphaerae bacterium GWF2_52_8]|nr:MAG: hypothetical protein A2X49_03970 [Lentisphaerae bacterium GWF2_52_8]